MRLEKEKFVMNDQNRGHPSGRKMNGWSHEKEIELGLQMRQP